MSRLARCEYTPSMADADARRLRGLPSSWEQAISESAIDGLKKRAGAVATTLARRGRTRDAERLRRWVSLLERADELHEHASDVELLAGLYHTLAAFAHEQDHALDDARVWSQTGALDASTTGHGAAFRETAALRNRAFRLVAAELARLQR